MFGDSGDLIYEGSSNVIIENGLFTIYCGHGQPDFDSSYLNIDIMVDGTSKLDDC